MGEADAAKDAAGIVAEVEAKRVVKVVPAVKAAVKAAVKVLERAEHVAANHGPLKKVGKEVVQHLVYVGVLGVQKVAVTVVNVLAKLVKANQNQNQNPNQNQDPNQDPNQYQEQIKS